ncbi:MAG: hypothetical protein WDO16_00105 [Bacteroidota bacterium]
MYTVTFHNDNTFFCPRWGSETINWDDFCKKAKETGYNGIEAGVPSDPAEKSKWLKHYTNTIVY